ncbi:GRAM protein, partial [Piaya cayana]|nr:GRAM protein [Piaya cayana]
VTSSRPRGCSRSAAAAVLGCSAVMGSDGSQPLWQLDGSVTLSRTRRLVGLLGKEPVAGAGCSLAGWGVRGHQGLSATLQEMEVTVLDARMCNNSRFWHGGIAPTMICFQGRRKGSAPSKVR